jgi:hypothetical protein
MVGVVTAANMVIERARLMDGGPIGQFARSVPLFADPLFHRQLRMD